MYCVYVLQSQKDRLFYAGVAGDLRKRIEKHQKGEVYSTKHRRPLKLVYYEACLDKSDAFRRERYLKTGMGKRYLRNRLKNGLGADASLVQSNLS